MAKTFTDKQEEIIARKLGYDGPMNMFEAFLNSSPAEARKYEMVRSKYMARGGMATGYAVGGDAKAAKQAAKAATKAAKSEAKATQQAAKTAAKVAQQEAKTAAKVAQQEAKVAQKAATTPPPPTTTPTTPATTTPTSDLVGRDKGYIKSQLTTNSSAADIKAALDAGIPVSTITRLTGIAKDQVKGVQAGTVSKFSWEKDTATGEEETATELTLPEYLEQPEIQDITAAQITPEAGQFVGTELAPEAATGAKAEQITKVAEAAAPTRAETAVVTSATAAPDVQQVLAGVQPAQGTVSTDALVQPAQMTPTETALADIEAASTQAQQVQATAPREVQAGELVAGPAVDQARVEQTLAQAEAAQGAVTEEMTVQGQLNKLLADFDSKNPPTWAAASLRNATAVMAQRGLGSSSLAGQAIIQATLEAALPVAAADAKVFETMGLQNLSNRQQMAVLTAQQRAQFLGQEFDQAFQTRVVNAAKISDIANLNFTAQQQVALENARLAQTTDLANLGNRQAVVMANAAQIASLETQNLNNRQQAAVTNAQAFLQMDLTNLSNAQQTELFKAQSNVQAILSDTAAENAARQFNASSINQTNQFFESLKAQVSQFNAAQTNALNQFNVDQVNAVSRFNAEAQNVRDQFNAANRLVIDQSNAQWRREIATINTAAINRTNEFNATAALQMSQIEYNNMWQTYRDNIEYAWKSGENELDRINKLAQVEMTSNATILAAQMAKDGAISASIGGAVGNILKGADVVSGITKAVSTGGSWISKGIDFVSSFF